MMVQFINALCLNELTYLSLCQGGIIVYKNIVKSMKLPDPEFHLVVQVKSYDLIWKFDGE